MMGTFSIHLKMAISGNEVDELSEISEEYNNPSSSSAATKRRAGTGKTRNVAKASYRQTVLSNPTCWNMLRSFGQTLRNMLQQEPTMLHDVA